MIEGKVSVSTSSTSKGMEKKESLEDRVGWWG